ncbi:MAG: tetratricopeptide repeat protein [Candidatus Omnitrophica bacterium]|nr:tetratricopeptide repeat protein [Candidatus Omnitrophota bacterium]
MLRNILKAVLVSVLIFSTSGSAQSFDFNVTSGTASSTIQKLSQKENKTADDYLTLGWAYYAFKNDVKEGAANLEKALEKDPGLYEAHLLLGLLYKSKGEYEKALPHWLKCFDSDRPENAVLVYYVHSFMFSLDNVRKIMAGYERIIGSTKEELIKPHAYCWLGYYYAVLGDAAKAKEAYGKLGYIKDWLVIGSFDNKENTGFNAVYPPETEIDLVKEYDGKSVKVKWRKLAGLSTSQLVDFDSVCYPNESATGYALTYVFSGEDRDVALRVGSDDSVKVWLNDKLIIQNEKYQAWFPDQSEAGAILRKGWNKILVKVCEGWGDWMFGLRITDVNGRPLEALGYSAEPKPYTSEAAALTLPGKTPVIRTIKNILREKANKDPGNYFSAYMLGEWLRTLDLKKESIDEFAPLVQKEPHCAIFRFGLAKAESNYGDDEKALANYKETIADNPEHAEALIDMAHHFYHNEMNEQALDYIKKAESASPGYIENYILTSLIYSDKDWYKDAYDTAKTGLAKYPESTRLLARMANCAADLFKVDEEMRYYEKIMELNAWYWPSRYRDFVDLCVSRGELPKIEEIYKGRAALYTFDSSFYDELADIARKAGDYQKTIEYCDKGSEISPDNYVFYVTKGSTYYLMGKKEEAIREWEKALELNPGYTWLRDKIKFVKGEEKTVIDKYAETEGSAEDLLKAGDISKKYPLADAVFILDKSIHDVHDDGSSEILTHRIIKIMTKEGIDKFTAIDLPGGSNLEIEKAVVRNPGKTDTEITEIDFKKGKLYPAGLKEGSIIEFKCRANHSGGLLRGRYYTFLPFNNLFPVYKAEVVVIVPKGKEVKVYKKDESVGYSTEALEDKIAHVWRGDYRDPIKLEPFMPVFNSYCSIIAVSDIPSWDYLADWENNLIDDQLELDPSIKAQVDQLTKDKKTQEEKVTAIYSYLGNNIHYLSLKHAVFGWKPNRATKIFKDGYGDCKDMATLMIAMLKSLGIDAYLALLDTKPYYDMITDIPIPVANHAIVYIPELDGKKTGLFIDVTAASSYNYGTVPWWDEGVTAIILKRPGYELARIPWSRADDNAFITKADIILSKGDQSKFKVEIKCYGQAAGMLRPEARKDNWSDRLVSSHYLGKYIQGISSLKDRTDNGSDMTKPFTVYAEFSAASPFKKAEAGKYELAPVFALRSMQDYAPLEKRVNDLDIYYAFTEVNEENLTMPENFKIVSTPEDVKIDNEIVSFERSYELKGNVLKLKCVFSIKKPLIKKEEYPAFRDKLIEIDKLDERHVIFSVK